MAIPLEDVDKLNLDFRENIDPFDIGRKEK
jgi:hypothetical protein